MFSRKRIYIIAGIAVIGSILFLNSCTKGYFDFDKLSKDTEWNPEFALPLVNSSFTIEDILSASTADDSLVEIGADKSISVIYRGTIVSLKASDIFVLPDQSDNKNIKLTPAEVISFVADGTVSASANQTINFVTAGTVDADTLFYKGGSLVVNASSMFQHDAEITITIPSAKKNGVAFLTSFTLDYTGTIPVTQANNINLSGYKFDMTLGGTNHSKYNVFYSVKLINSGNPVSISDDISFTLNSNNQLFDKIFGTVTETSIHANADTVRIDMFDSITGTFSLVDPQLKVTFYNSFGVPLNVAIVPLAGFSPSSGFNPITGVPNPLPIKTPGLNQVGQTLDSSFTLSQASGSNIASVINSFPKKIIYGASAKFNPGGALNFVMDTSEFRIDMDVRIPLWGKASGFTLMDTVDLGLDTIKAIKSLTLRTYIVNGFPVDVNVQVYITDTLYNVIDSIITGSTLIMPGGPVDANGKVISPVTDQRDYVYDQARLNKLFTAKKAIIKAILKTANYSASQDVKFFSDDRLTVKLGVKAGLSLNFKDLNK